jgi:hypothetical protein
MLIIKPYGRSSVDCGTRAQRLRVIAPRGASDTRVDVETFAVSHDELVTAQWISTIDKIARKPGAKTAPTDDQREFRRRLGEACWSRLEAGGLVPGFAEPATKERLKRVWDAKIAPYGAAPSKPRPGRAPPPTAKGVWFERFAGGAQNVCEVSAAAVAAQIERHLHASESRASNESAPRRLGQIQARARSISRNVLAAKPPAYAGGMTAGWAKEDCDAYGAAGDVAAAIRQAAEARESGQHALGKGRVGVEIAAAVLFTQYARVFKMSDGQPMTIAQARSLLPSLFNLHMAIKDCYARILKEHRKDRGIHGQARRKVSSLLPDTMNALFRIIEFKRLNRDLSGLVRLGKVIHYEASVVGEDTPRNAVDNWPSDVSDSFFWTSDGQVEIKRYEAFVRIWRRVLALANRTLTDWAGSNFPVGEDILLSGPIKRVTGPDFDSGAHEKKLGLLFGARAHLFQHQDDTHQRAVLEFALKGIAQLRHSAFHFKGFGSFVEALAGLERDVDPIVMTAARQLWALDESGRVERLVQTAFAAHLSFYFDTAKCEAFIRAVVGNTPCPLALPRFGRVMARATNAWSEEPNALGLPSRPSHAERKDPATYCRFEALRLVYDHAFRMWLHDRDTPTLNGFIDRAVSRATTSARDLNAAGDADSSQIMVSKASTLGRLRDGERIERFFAKLSAETASEMRVQRGYGSDADRAREQADYIEKLKLDVVALAFSAFLNETGLDFLLALAPGTSKPRMPTGHLAVPPHVSSVPEDWQAALYFLVHLIPVEEINRLLHQMQRWVGMATSSVAASLARAEKVQSVLELYRDMHDAKFEGGLSIAGAEPFAALYARQADFERVFPKTEDATDDLRIAKRGLREIMRFGHLPLLRAVFEKQLITEAEVSGFFAAQAPGPERLSVISRLQAERELLHARWVREQREFPGADRARYKAVLKEVTRYRHLAGRVILADHVRLHRLLLAVWGRLLDYSGLWERDLYFSVLALLHLTGVAPANAFSKDGLKMLKNGQIASALQHGQPASIIADGLTPHFTGVCKKDSRAIKIRNKLAHLNMLRSRDPVDLTFWINQARELMAHDRKLKNAVSQSVRELLHRENLDLTWSMEEQPKHNLGASTVMTRQAFHLGGRSIAEDLHSDDYVRMAAALFSRCDVKRAPPFTPAYRKGGPRSAPVRQEQR